MRHDAVADNHHFLDAALRIGNQLASEAYWHDGRCTWMGDDFDQVNGEWKVVHHTVDPYMYAGTAGIARFLTQCWEISGDENLREAAIGAIRQSINLVNQTASAEPSLGLYDGLTGIAVTAAEVGRSVREPELVHAASRFVNEICARLKEEYAAENTDLVSGSAGVLVGLIQLSETCGNPELLKECETIFNHLVRLARQTPHGWYWTSDAEEDSTEGLCGFGHGAAGIAYAILEFYRISNDHRCLETAGQAFRHERCWFNRREMNWPDLRGAVTSENSPRTPVYPVFWCHGAAGIGYSRLHAYKITGDKTVLAEASAAVQTAVRYVRRLVKEERSHPDRKSAELNLSVCHGMGSIVELFTAAYQILEVDDFLKRARDIGRFALHISGQDTEDKEYWRCGIQGGGEAPGLMPGLSGIGWNFLRLYQPTPLSAAGLLACP